MEIQQLLDRVTKKMVEFEKHSSQLTKDMLLDELRIVYDVIAHLPLIDRENSIKNSGKDILQKDNTPTNENEKQFSTENKQSPGLNLSTETNTQKQKKEEFARIPLNEKFGIIRSLFRGNASDFADAILSFKSANQPNELIEQFQQLKTKFGWDESTDDFKVLSDYVRKWSDSLK